MLVVVPLVVTRSTLEMVGAVGAITVIVWVIV
jgi:hypothetical protein